MKFDYADSSYSFDAEQQGPMLWVYVFIGNGRYLRTMS